MGRIGSCYGSDSGLDPRLGMELQLLPSPCHFCLPASTLLCPQPLPAMPAPTCSLRPLYPPPILLDCLLLLRLWGNFSILAIAWGLDHIFAPALASSVSKSSSSSSGSVAQPEIPCHYCCYQVGLGPEHVFCAAGRSEGRACLSLSKGKQLEEDRLGTDTERGSHGEVGLAAGGRQGGRGSGGGVVGGRGSVVRHRRANMGEGTA